MISIKPILKTGDYLVIAGLVLIIIATFWIGPTSKKGTTAIVYIDNKQVDVLSLNRDRSYEYKGSLGVFVLNISHGHLRMVSSPCPHQICVKMGEISRNGSMIICVPNRIIIRIAGKSTADIDGVTQ